MVGSSIFVLETELVPSSKIFVSTSHRIPKYEILEELRNCVTDVQQHAPCSPLMDEWNSFVPLKVHPMHPKGKSPTVGIKVISVQLQQKPCIPKAIH